MNNVIKDCGEIWNRLFDHRPFLSGEILYFQEEFEVKRNDREVTRLFEVLEHVTEIRETQIDKVKNLSESNLQTYQDKVNSALSKCNAILESEKNYNVDTNLEVKREIRKSEWERFECDMQAKYASVDQTFNEKEKELCEFYVDLEKKLHIKDSKHNSK